MWFIAVPIACLVIGLAVGIRDEIKFKGSVPANYRFTLQFCLCAVCVVTAFVVMVTRG
jgi:hypothetical protein